MVYVSPTFLPFLTKHLYSHVETCHPDCDAVPLQEEGRTATHRGEWDAGASSTTAARPS